MALENYIIGASNTGAAGYHNAMAGMDQRKREAEVDRHNAFNRMNVDRQYKDTKMREAFEMAALMDVDETNNGPALDYLDRVSDELGVQRPERSQIGPALRTYRTQIGNNLPSNVQEMQWISEQGGFTPQENNDYLRIVAGLKPRAGQRVVRAPDGSVYLSEGSDGLTTLVTPQQAIEGAGRKAGTEQAARETAITEEIPARGEAQRAEDKKNRSAEAKSRLPVARQTVSRALATLQALERHPGLAGGTGFDWRRSQIPGTPEFDFAAKLKTAVGGSFLEAREELKGGGPITDYEGKNAQSALANLEQAQSKEAFLEALAEYRGAIVRGYRYLEQQAGEQPSELIPTKPMSIDEVNADVSRETQPPRSVEDLVRQYAPD